MPQKDGRSSCQLPQMELTEDNVRPNKELLLNNTNVRANSDNSRGRGETTMCQFYASDGFMYVPIYKVKYKLFKEGNKQDIGFLLAWK